MTDTPPPDGPMPPEATLGPPAPETPDGPPAPDGPPPPETPVGSGPRSAVIRLVLGLIAFVATLLLLGGLASLVGSPGGRGVVVPSPALTDATPSDLAGVVSPSAPSVTGPASASPSADPVLVGAGDIADCGLDGDAATASVLDSVEGTVFTTGDNAYPDGSPDQFRDCYGPTWGRHLARARPAPGNHDWVTRDLAGYLGYFGAAAAPNGTSWYSYDLGTWHVIVLDSDCSSVGGCGQDSAQGRWLIADLAASTARCTIAIWHHPRFSSGEHGSDPSVAPFWQALHDAGADLVINGHDHDYERFAPQDPEGREDGARGIREFVVGTGGAALRTFPKQAANSELRNAAYHGVLRLDLHPTSYDWRFIPTSGDFSDSGSGRCH